MNLHTSFHPHHLSVPVGKLAGNPQSGQSHPLARPMNKNLADSLADKLAKGKPVAIGPKGKVSDKKSTDTLSCPDGRLAENGAQPHPLARPRQAAATNASLAESLADKLAAGKPIAVGAKGKVSDKNKTDTLQTPRGELADTLRGNMSAGRPKKLPSGKPLCVPPARLCAQWYHQNPALLAVETASMRDSIFSDFVLKELNDGTLYWDGYLQPGIMQDACWHVCAVYPVNFPTPIMGGTMRVYLADPSLKQIEDTLGVRLHHVLFDNEGDRYICTARADDVDHIRRGRDVAYTGAVTSLLLATKWLTALELVLTGRMSLSLFNSPGGI